MQRIGLFGMQIWGIRRNGPNDSEGKFEVYAEEHGFGKKGRVDWVLGRRNDPVSSSLKKHATGLACVFTQSIGMDNEDETGSFRLPGNHACPLTKETFIIVSTRARALHRGFAFPPSPFSHHGGEGNGCGGGMNDNGR